MAEQPYVHIMGVNYSRHIKPFSNSRKQPFNRYLIRLQVKGKCKIMLNGTTHDIQPGDLILSKPSDLYGIYVEEESADFFVSCKGEWMDRWWARNTFPEKVNIALDEGLLSIWRRLVYEKRNIHGNNTELLDHLLKALCLSLERWIYSSVKHTSGSPVYVPYQIKEYIERHATEPLTLEQIARRHEVSLSTASHLFKKTFNQSIMRYVVEVRLAIAAERILISGSSLEKIAELSGFRSYPYFCRAFRAKYSLSPSEYKTRHRLL